MQLDPGVGLQKELEPMIQLGLEGLKYKVSMQVDKGTSRGPCYDKEKLPTIMEAQPSIDSTQHQYFWIVSIYTQIWYKAKGDLRQ